MRIHFQALAKELAARGHRVVLIFDPQGKKLPDEIFDLTLPVYSWPTPRFRSITRVPFFIHLIKKYRPDCLIANFEVTNLMMRIGWLMRIPCRIAWIHSVKKQYSIDHNGSPHKYHLEPFGRRLVFKAATHITAVSRDSCEDTYRCLGGPRKKYKALYLSCPERDDTGYRPDPDGAIGMRLICPGRLVPSKGQEVLIRAAVILSKKYKNLKIEFAGNGPLRKELELLVKKLALSEVCFFTGMIGHEETIQKMAASYATVVPSLADAMPLVMAESFSVGTPVVGSNVNGIPEAVSDGLNGFLFPPGDAEALAQKIDLLLSNPVLRKSMKAASLRIFRERFSQKAIIPEQAAWFEEITSHAKSYGKISD